MSNYTNKTIEGKYHTDCFAFRSGNHTCMTLVNPNEKPLHCEGCAFYKPTKQYFDDQAYYYDKVLKETPHLFKKYY